MNAAKHVSLASAMVFSFAFAGTILAESPGVFRAGASAVDITPTEFPVKIVGGFFEATATKANDRLYARCLVLDDGRDRLAITVVDNCLIPQDVFDRAKDMAQKTTGLPTDRMMMSATHTHSGPSVVGALGTDPDEKYREFLPGQIAKAVEAAVKNLAPARIGWTVVQDPDHTHCRRWIRRPDKIDVDPFGRATVRAMMHPGYQNPDYLGPAGPVDTGLSVLAVQSPAGRPVAVMANYSMHYFGAPPVSADYFGLFAAKFAQLAGTENADPVFVAMMSQGTAGDLHWMDYAEPQKKVTIDAYAQAVAQVAYDAYKTIQYHEHVPLVMREKKLTLTMRPISPEDLARAKEIVAGMNGRYPKDKPELYARDQVIISQSPPTREMKLQALRIGDLGIAAIPCEVFGITGLEIKMRSPLTPTFNIELANGYFGYIPPPEQHTLGGYTTWRARSAGLEVQAAPKIVSEMLAMLEEVAGKPRRTLTSDDYPFGDYPKAILASKPFAYWRANEFGGPQVADASGNNHHGQYEGGVALYLEGPQAGIASDPLLMNRSPHFAGGRMKAAIKNLGHPYTVEVWFNNYLPVNLRPVTGVLFSNGADGVQLGIGGTAAAGGRLFVGIAGTTTILPGKTDIVPKTWHHVALVRNGQAVRLYLDGQSAPEISADLPSQPPSGTGEFLIAAGTDSVSSFEGRIDESAVFNRALTPEEIARHVSTAKP